MTDCQRRLPVERRRRDYGKSSWGRSWARRSVCGGHESICRRDDTHLSGNETKLKFEKSKKWNYLEKERTVDFVLFSAVDGREILCTGETVAVRHRLNHKIEELHEGIKKIDENRVSNVGVGVEISRAICKATCKIVWISSVPFIDFSPFS